jgi:hypothetical protein
LPRQRGASSRARRNTRTCPAWFASTTSSPKTVGTPAGCLWESRQAAEAVYSGEWRERVTKLYGTAPSITWFETPVIVDNATSTARATAA